MTEKNKQSYEDLSTELKNLKEFEQQLVDSEKKYRSLTENLNVGIYRNTPGAKGKFIEVNPAFLKIFGYKDKTSILNLHVSDLYGNPNERRKTSDKLKQQGFLKNEQVKLVKKDGTPIICSIFATSVKDNNGKVTHYDGIIEDITDRVKRETQIKESEERYHKLFDSSKDAIMTLSPPKWNFTSGNSAIMEMFKVKDLNEFTSMGPWDISPDKQPDGRKSTAKAKEMIGIAMKEGSGYFKWTHKRLNGETFPATVLLTRVILKGETFLQATVRDISDRKRAEELREKLLDTAQHLTKSLDLNIVLEQISKQARSLLECHGISIYMLDDDGVTINPVLSNDPPYDDIVMSTKLNINKSLTGKTIKVKKGMIFNDTNIETGSFHLPGTPKSDDDHVIISPFIIDNKVIGTMNLYRDIFPFSEDDLIVVNTFATYASTAIKNARNYEKLLIEMRERRIAEEEMRTSEEKYRSLVNNSPDIILRVELDGTITYINYKFAGLTSEEIVGKTIYDLMPSEFHDKAKISLEKVFSTGRSFNYENLGLSNEDQVVWYRNNIAPIRSNGNVIGATIIARDITEEKQIDVMKTEFISSVSHELRTPLTIIQESISQVLDGIYGDPTEGQKEVLIPCMEDTARLSRIINNLLDISKIEGQKVSISREMIDIVKLAKNVLFSFKNKADGKNLELKFKTSIDEIELYIDGDRIIQVFMNLIGNAIKFTEKGEIVVSIEKSENSVKCTVSDTGIGIVHKDIATVFDRFHQVGRISSSTEKGTGLGLSISKGIVELHNGRIFAESIINKGSQFHFTIPIYTVDEILFENIEQGIAVATKKHIKLSLLIIRLNNFEEIEKILGLEKAKETTHRILEAFQDVIAPGEFSFIKGRNEVILFSDITKKNISPIVEKLETILANFVSNFSKELDIVMSYGYSIYPNDAHSAKDLLQSAYKTLLIKNNHK